MEVSPTTNVANSAATGAAKTLAQDFDTFLTLLTSQLQNQDPLEPMDSSEFTNQLVQFSSVEQAIQTNKNLESLLSLTNANTSSSALGYLGKEVTVSGNAADLTDTGAVWAYHLAPGATASSIAVKDATGKVVYAQDGADTSGQHIFAWDGKDNTGNALPPGTFTLSVAAVDSEQSPVIADVFATGTITGVDLSDEDPVLSMGSVRTALSDVVSVSEPTKTNGS